MSVRWARVGEIARFIGGGTPRRDNEAYFGGNIPWVTPKDMKSWEIERAQVNITEDGLANSAARIAPANSVLIVVRSGVLKHTVPVGVNRVAVAINQDMKALVCSEGISADYVARFIKGRSTEILGWVRATTADNFPVELLRELRIPLPVLDEQRRVVELLDRADALRAKRYRALARLDEFGQSIFLDMFGDIVANDRNWPMVRVDSIVSRFQGGKSLLSPRDDSDAIPFRILKISAVTSGEFLAVENKPAPQGYTPKAEHFVRPGDLLFSRANTSELIGATAVVDECPPNLLMPDKLWRFVWRRPLVVHPLFVRQVFHQPRFRELVSSVSTGSSGSMKNISQAKLSALPFALPPYVLQEKFAHVVTSISCLRLTQRAHLTVANALFAALQYRAFRGGL